MRPTPPRISALTASPSVRSKRPQAAANAAAFFFLDGSAFFGYDNSTYAAEEYYVHVFFFLRTHFLHMPFVE
jgi:hypothetical protein